MARAGGDNAHAGLAARRAEGTTAARSVSRLPLLTSLRGYQRASLVPDLLAALTLLVIAVPEQLATSRLAGMPPITGFYAFIAGTVLFALLGSNPQMSVGADSTIAPLFAVGIAHLAPSGSADYTALVGLLAVTVGAIVLLVGLLRLGWIAEFLSAPIITGFMAGVSVIIVVHQLPDLLGISSAGGATIPRLVHVATQLRHTNGWTFGIGLVVFLIVIAAEHIDRRLPGALFGLVGSTAVVAAFSLKGHGVSVLGAVAHGAPHVGLHHLSFSTFDSVLPLAAVVALIVISQSAATTRAFADQGHYSVDVGRDFVGVGAGSIVAGLTGSFPVNASPARTAAVASASGRTQVTGLAAAVALALLIPAAGVLRDVPLATLAAVLIFVATRIFHLRDLASIARFDHIEFGLTIVTLLTVALVGVEQGIAVAVVLALLDRTRLSARPQLHELAQIPGTTSWVPPNAGVQTTAVPGILVLLFPAPLWYANAEHFRIHVSAALAHAAPSPRLLVLDVMGMSDLDYTGSRALGDVLDDLDRDHIVFALARSGHHVQESLQRSGLLKRIGADHVFPSVGAAVAALSGTTHPSATPAS